MTQNNRDAEIIASLVARAHENIRIHALSKDPNERGYLNCNFIYELNAMWYRVVTVAPTWPKKSRSVVVFEIVGGDQMYTLPVSKWVAAGFKAVLDQFDFHSFREHIHAKMTQSESLQLDLCALCRNLGLSDDRVPIDYLPALLDGTEELVGGSCREELLGFAVQCLSTRQQCDTQP